jgi:DinB superfamily
MNFTSVAQIFEAIDETRQRLFNRVEGLTDEQANAQPGANAWSVKDIIEHLTIMEDRLVRMMKVMLTKAEGASARSNGGAVEIKPFSLEKLIERSRSEKYTAPEAVRPSGTAHLPDLLAKMRGSREELRALQSRIEATDLSAFTYPHPAFGPLDFYQWLALIGLHEERHLNQIESVLQA